jgi:hypothetical protein
MAPGVTHVTMVAHGSEETTPYAGRGRVGLIGRRAPAFDRVVWHRWRRQRLLGTGA